LTSALFFASQNDCKDLSELSTSIRLKPDIGCSNSQFSDRSQPDGGQTVHLTVPSERQLSHTAQPVESQTLHISVPCGSQLSHAARPVRGQTIAVPGERQLGHAEQPGVDWLARRVDLIVIPASQYYYGLVGWTGSKHFNRSLRLYSQRELGLRLTSHGLYDVIQKRYIPASSEREVFQNLRLIYREPQERNC